MFSGLLTSVEDLAEQEGIHLERQFRPARARMLVDIDKLEKIVINLSVNAIKFTPTDGSICMKWEFLDGK
jgi:signal transduction histidine kinase